MAKRNGYRIEVEHRLTRLEILLVMVFALELGETFGLKEIVSTFWR